MEMNLMSWKNEMENMLAAIDRQTTHSLCVIKSIFKRCGQSLPPDFKQHFLEASSSRIKTTFEQFEIHSSLEDSTDLKLHSVADAAGGPSNNGQRVLTSEARNDRNPSVWIDDSDHEDLVMGKLKMKSIDDPLEVGNDAPSNTNPNEIEIDTISTQNTSDSYIFNNGLVPDDDLHEINVPIAHQLNANEDYTIDPDSSDFNFDVEMDESNDSIDEVENQSASTDVVANKLTLVNESNKIRVIKMEKTNERDNVAIRNERSSSKQLARRNQKSCSVCGYVTFHTGMFNRHMRTHTGEKPFGCEICKMHFAQKSNLKRHLNAIHSAINL